MAFFDAQGASAAMALYSFQIPAMVYVSLAAIAAVAILLIIFSFDWTARLRTDTAQRDKRRLTQATLELNRTLGDRDRLNAQYALSLQYVENKLRDAKAEAARELSTLQEQLEQRDLLIKRLKLRLKEKSAATQPSPHRKARNARGGSDKSRRGSAKPDGRAIARAKASVREARLH
jgi:hypothetical protein